eukprot:5813257-Pyramimonas_sp.AAC.1
MLLQKVSLNNAQMLRLVSGSLWDFFSAEGERKPVGAAAEGGINYAEEVKAKGSKEMGSPRLHAGA